MMENKISVVINTYNAEKFLAEVLESVKGFDEILVCDMESTDHTNLSDHDYYQTDLGGFCSPIIFFDPSGEYELVVKK